MVLGLVLVLQEVFLASLKQIYELAELIIILLLLGSFRLEVFGVADEGFRDPGRLKVDYLIDGEIKAKIFLD